MKMKNTLKNLAATCLIMLALAIFKNFTPFTGWDFIGVILLIIGFSYNNRNYKRLKKIENAVKIVCWFDWSGNDPDASFAMDELRKLSESKE